MEAVKMEAGGRREEVDLKNRAISVYNKFPYLFEI